MRIYDYEPKLPITVNEYKSRDIKYAFHDVDGTHSLIRTWQPVMSAVLSDVIENGLSDRYDDERNVTRLVDLCGKTKRPETDSFCIESAGLSGITQMEWAIRRGIEENKIDIYCDRSLNSLKIKEIWAGREIFEQEDSPELKTFLDENCGRLFRLYEKVLNAFCRDKNLADAKNDPEKYRVKGSMKFLRFLKEQGVKSYFVTGAVVEQGKGMAEEIETLGFSLGKNGLAEALVGSTWDEKLPKNVIMKKLLDDLGAKGEEVLVAGDGRSEIFAGVEMGAFTIGRLDKSAKRQRQILTEIGVNVIVENFDNKDFYRLFKKPQS